MTKINAFVFSLIAIVVLTAFDPIKKADDKPGFTVTINGGPFDKQTFYLSPTNANYENLYFDYKQDERAKRTVLAGYKTDNSILLRIDVPIHKTTGSYTFEEDNIPVYMGFQISYEKNSTSAMYMPGKITINITKYGNVGEFIEGNFSGELQPRAGADKAITVTGTFKVKRLKDKI